MKSLKYVSEIVLGKMLTNEDKGDFILKPYLRAANLNWLFVNIEDVKEMWFSKREIEKYKLNLNDLLVSEGGEVGRTCIWKNEIEECYIQNSIHKVTIDVENDPYYFLYQFWIMGKKGVFDSIVNKISIAHLTVEKLKEITHLTTKVTDKSTRKREFDLSRSIRLHWVKFHVGKQKGNNILIFSVDEPDGIRTYIYDKDEEYVIVLEPLRNKSAYFLLSAYYMEGKDKARNKMMRKYNRRLSEIL